MKNNKLSVTVGISAYNEEKNIGKLLRNLLSQKRSAYKLDKIIVVSDASEDTSSSEVKKIKNPLVQVINNPVRKGKPYNLNLLIKTTNSDILVILDADILIEDKLFLEKLIMPIVRNGADLTSAAIRELEPKTLIQKILKASMEFKKNIYENYREGNNLYTCHGRARAFSRRLYRSINFKDTVADDAFSYLFCVKNNFKYFFAKDAKVFYKLPENLADHEKQSVRFFKARNDLAYRFTSNFIELEYQMPQKLILYLLLKTVIKYPIILLYFPIVIYLKIKSLFVKDQSPQWEISGSSKLIESDL